ncbi:MAG: LysE family transporter [Proteobacteria bacterium]|nr:LysE family transporter [Pseudomonadota bacterium]
MTWSTWLALFVACWLISLSPGAGAVSCMAAGMRYGFARAWWNIIGLQAGVMFVLAVVAAGLGAMLAASTVAFALVKWAGVAYLVYLGVQQWRAPAAPISTAAADTGDGTPRALMTRGFLVNATNPKAILFMLAVLPQFIDASRPLAPQYLIAAATLLVTDAVVMSAYTAFAARLLRLLRGEAHVRWLNRTFGGMFVVAGVVLATFRR